MKSYKGFKNNLNLCNDFMFKTVEKSFRYLDNAYVSINRHNMCLEFTANDILR